MKLFKRRKPVKRPYSINTNFHRLEIALEQQHRKWSGYLNGKTASATKTEKLKGLIVFCLLFGGSIVCLLVKDFRGSSSGTKPDKIAVPAYIVPGNDTALGSALDDQATVIAYRNIQQFKRAMDSLQRTVTGKVLYDSIYKARPGLMDSVAFIESIFTHSQNINNEK